MQQQHSKLNGAVALLDWNLFFSTKAHYLLNKLYEIYELRPKLYNLHQLLNH